VLLGGYIRNGTLCFCGRDDEHDSLSEHALHESQVLTMSVSELTMYVSRLHQDREMCAGLRERYEAHHKLRYTDDALMCAATYSHQYISDRFLPDKAIDLIDEAGSRVRLRHAQLPEEAREVEKELRQIQKEKDGCVRSQVS
jgi:ATP-dependent Clp protease ATP-binding subunit ClpA